MKNLLDYFSKTRETPHAMNDTHSPSPMWNHKRITVLLVSILAAEIIFTILIK